MVLIFSDTTSILTDEYVKSFSSERLAVNLFKIASDTGVKLSKESESFCVSGNWGNVILAHAALEHFLEQEVELPEIQEETKLELDKAKKLLEKQKYKQVGQANYDHQRGRRPGTTVDCKRYAQDILPKPLIVHEDGSGILVPIEVFNKPHVQTKADETVAVNISPTICNDASLNVSNNTGDSDLNKDNGGSTSRTNIPDTVQESANGVNDCTSSVTNKDRQENVPEIEVVGENSDVVGKVTSGLPGDLPQTSNVKLEIVNDEADAYDEDTDIEESYINDDKTTGHQPAAVTGTARLNIKVENVSDEEHILSKNKNKKRANVSARTDKTKKKKKKKKCIKDKKLTTRKKSQKDDEKSPKTLISEKQIEDKAQQENLKREKKTLSNDVKTLSNDVNCTKCDYKGKKRSNLREHVKRMHGARIQCNFNYCNKTFGLKKELARHTRHVHTQPAFFCEICGKLYKTGRAHSEHMKIHEDNYTKPSFPCEICDKTFSTKYVLTGHVNSEHLGMKKSYLCPLCGRSFTQKNSYLQHANVHAGIKPFVCDICGRAFSYDKSLKEHRYMHDTERRFECKVCSKTFRQKASLQIHLKVHKETKDYMCQACGKGFTQKQALHRHERTHSGEKPFKCALCARTFNDYSIIRRHMIMLHKRDPKDTNSWKHDVVCTLKRKNDFYIEGGPGYSSTERLPTRYHPEDGKPEANTDKDKQGNINTDLNSRDENLAEDKIASSHTNVGSVSQQSSEQRADSGEVIPEPDQSNINQPEGGELHNLSRVAYPVEETKTEQMNGSPINYSLPSDYTSNMRTNAIENIVSYQNVVEPYRSGINSRDSSLVIQPLHSASGLLVQGNASLAASVPEPATSQAISVEWVCGSYPSIPYYNPQNFQHYQGPTS